MDRKKKVHVLAFPYPLPGHINPMMLLCKKLVTKGMLVTFLNTDLNQARLFQQEQGKEKKEKEEEVKDKGIRFMSIQGGFPLESYSDRSRFPELFKASEDMATPFHSLLTNLLLPSPSSFSSSCSRVEEEEEESADEFGPVDFVLSDLLLSWTCLSAAKLGVPAATFWSGSAAVLACLLHARSFFEDVVLPIREINYGNMQDIGELVVSSTIAGHDSFQLKDFPLDPNIDTLGFMYDFTNRQIDNAKKSTWILLNTFLELEDIVIGTLKKTLPILAIGPLLNPSTTHTTSMFLEDRSCLSWLDGHKPNSVLYISFGSIFTMSFSQFQDLGKGLIASNQPFLWVIRHNFLNGLIDEGSISFYNCLKEHGLIVSWCPQLEVLSHPSIGGFISHCGWNSILESITKGVPILCWPDTGERRNNSRFVVGQWGVGLGFSRAKDGSVSQKEVERVVKQLMQDESGDGMRARVKAQTMSEIAKKVTKESGSSFINLKTFVDIICNTKKSCT